MVKSLLIPITTAVGILINEVIRDTKNLEIRLDFSGKNLDSCELTLVIAKKI